MKTIITIIAAMALTSSGLFAQEFKLVKTSGTLEIREVNHVTVEGYDGNEIVFSVHNQDHDPDRDQRSKGLRAISNQGLEDNTGLGLSVVDKGTTVEVRQMKKMDGPEVKIMVPKGVSVSYDHNSPYGGDIRISKVTSDVEVSTVHNGVKLDNLTGAVDIKTVHGEIEATFGDNLKSAIHLESVHGPVDVSFPVTVKANVRARSEHGEILVDPDFKMDIDKSGGMIHYNDGVTGKINGGGIDVRLSSNHNNVYLRKK